MKKLLTLVSIILFAIALTACGNDKSGNSYDSKKTVTIKNTYEFKDKNNTHHRGETKTDTVKVPYNPNRVAVLDYGALDVMKQLGLQNKIVSIAKGQGNSFLPSSLAEFKDDKYSNLGNPGRPNFDQLAKSKPELILASFRQAHTKTIDEMKKAAPNAKILFVSPDNDHYLSSIKSHTSTIGKIFNDFQPIVVRIFDKINTHFRILIADTAHRFMLGMSGFIIFRHERQMEFVVAQVVRFFPVA